MMFIFLFEIFLHGRPIIINTPLAKSCTGSVWIFNEQITWVCIQSDYKHTLCSHVVNDEVEHNVFCKSQCSSPDKVREKGVCDASSVMGVIVLNSSCSSLTVDGKIQSEGNYNFLGGTKLIVVVL